MAWLRSLLFLFLFMISAGGAGAQYPVPRERPPEPAVSVEPALRLLAAERYDEAVEAFEAAGRASANGLPADALRAWGLAASEAGRPLAAYVRLRQYLSRMPFAPDRAGLEERVSRARDRLLESAAQFSRVFAAVERRPDEEAVGERRLARVAAREGEVSIEGMRELRPDALVWRRAEEIPLGPYLGLVRRLLDLPALIDDLPAQPFDRDAPGPRRAAVVRLVIGEEERRLEALHGQPYERLEAVVDSVIEFARSAPAVVAEPDPKPAAKPPVRRPAAKQRKPHR